MESLVQAIAATCKDLFGVEVTPELKRTDEQFGDFSTNVAMQLAAQLDKNPREIAEAVAKEVEGKNENVQSVKVAGPGFLNITLSDKALNERANSGITKSLDGKTVVAEYSDPNPFKVLHAGHLYTSVVGDAIANLAQAAGARVYRVNFGGDVGLHAAKTMWAILQALGGENPGRLADVKESERSDWLSARYVEGNAAYEDLPDAKQIITELNKKIYQLHADKDKTTDFAQIYWTTRQWSYDYFDKFYAKIGTKFDKYYPESITAPIGLKTVQEQLSKGVYQESQGAIIFDGEKYGLHSRVFINSAGLPTYEAKDIGLSIAKEQDYHPDKSIIITGNDIVEYMKVVLKSLEQFMPETANSTTHLTHGIVKLKDSGKMSSRLGNILKAEAVLETATQASKKINDNVNEQTVLAAVKYSFLKQRLGADIIYDPEESVSIHGNSGPYLQYAHSRAQSILAKAGLAKSADLANLQVAERSMLRKIGEFSEVVDRAVQELMPHHIATYLYELAQTFNSFYEKNRVIGDPRQELRVALVSKYADVLKSGLELLGISAPEKM